MLNDVLILEMDEGALTETELERVKKELEMETGCKVITITKRVSGLLNIHSMKIIMGQEPEKG